LLSSAERLAAQRRWTEGLARIESGTRAGISRLLSSSRAQAQERTLALVAEARKSADPQFFVSRNIDRLAAQIRAEYEKVNKERVAAVLAASMESAYLLGTNEGGKRVARVRRKAPVRVATQKAATDRQRIRQQATEQVGEWTTKTAERAGKTASRSVLADVVLGTATTAISLTRSDQYRTNLLSRNMLTGAGRGGMDASFTANGMEAWIWLAGPNACEVCWGKTGLVFPASTPFESHPNCQCSQEPAMANAEGFDADTLFARIPEQQQIRVLGPGKHSLWKSKSISLRDIPDGTKAKTLRQLRPARKGMGDIPVPVDALRAPPRGMRLKEASASRYLQPDGTLSPARQRLHDQIVEEWLAGKTAQQSPQIMMLGGGPASGKTSLLKSGKYTSKALAGDKPNAVVINSDDIKERLLGHIPKKIRSSKEWATYTHEESSYLSKRIVAAAIERRMNLVVDAVGSNVDGTVARIATARGAGYRVTGMYVSIPVDTAIARSAERTRRLIAKGKDGRVVPENVIAESHIGVSTAFSRVVGQFDDLVLLDNSQAQGKPARVIARLVRGRLVIENERLYDEFLQKGMFR